jgi:hypothetical protein
MSTAHAADFFNAFNNSDYKKPVQTQTQPLSNADVAKKIVGGVTNRLMASPEETAKAKKEGVSIEELKLRERQEFLRSQISKQQKRLGLAKKLESFVKAEKQITVGEKKYIDVYIPYNTLSTIKFDASIKAMSFLEQPNVIIRVKNDAQNEIEILNKQPELSINVKVVFVNDEAVTFVIQTGKAATKRYIDYKIFTDNQSIVTKTLFVKPTRMKTIHNDFNNKAIYLIISRIDKNEFYDQLRENMFSIDKVLFSGSTQVETLYGLQKVNYTLKLNNVYESPFLQSDKKNSKIKKRLVLMESTIRNDSQTESLTINETLIKNRFGNYVAFWLGDLDTQENVLSPGQELRFLLVIEDKVS